MGNIWHLHKFIYKKNSKNNNNKNKKPNGKKRHKINIHIYIYMQTYKHTNILDQNKIKENKKKDL